ncbi:hypothetical protein [Methylobacterium sp. C25]|uniref:hypothetical protein n=1 Tax=Methylobacterium sp. C25 TaxID=2721622 RepID=UPI001F437B7F|nr:hypothetical protein [Methylobacterium sp. C25]
MSEAPASPAIAEAVRALLARGVESAVITRDQAERLGALAAEPDEAADDERLRFITGFADIFVTFGILLFLGAANTLAASILGPLSAYPLVAILAWGLAEPFTRVRRMALPSIVLLLIFALSSFAAVVVAIAGEAVQFASLGKQPNTLLAAAIVTVALVALHYWRFAVPITIAAGTAALVAAALALSLSVAPETAQQHLNVVLACAGVAVFALAMRFDLSDPARLTRRSDIAFWLHLLAAPLIVHPVLSTLVSSQARPRIVSDTSEALVSSGASSSAQIAVLAVVLLLSVVALVTDRRAILVSGLAYAGYTIGDLIRQTGLTNAALPLSLLTLGAFVLLLSAGWRPLRKAVLLLVPTKTRQRLPHPVGV